MAQFIINKDYSGSYKGVEADHFFTAGDFVDFLDEEGNILYRIKASNVHTIERVSAKQ